MATDSIADSELRAVAQRLVDNVTRIFCTFCGVDQGKPHGKDCELKELAELLKAIESHR